MLRAPRGSNSVCGRIIQKENFSPNNINHSIGREDSLEVSQTSNGKTLDECEDQNSKPKKKRRIVQVMDVAESQKQGHPKFIQFKERLHPWTTIKELKQKIHQIKGFHIHRQRLFLNNFELLNSETLDNYGLLQEQSSIGDLNNQEGSEGSENSRKQTYQSEQILYNHDNQGGNKIVNLKLASNLAKLSKLNRMNSQKDSQSSPSKKQQKPDKCDIQVQSQQSLDQHHRDTSQCIEVFGSMQCPQDLQLQIKEVESGFLKGLKPKLTDDGTSGTYILRGLDRQPMTIFKPIDEEAFAPNNPRDHVGPFGSRSFRAGVLSGEACIREVAACLLDKEGFSGVPSTTMVETSHESLRQFKFSSFEIVTESNDYVDMMTSIIAPENIIFNQQLSVNNQQSESQQNHIDGFNNTRFLKIGSLQSFVESEGSIDDFSSDLFPKDEIHKIAILDLRILNLDRNGGNILVQHSGVVSCNQSNVGFTDQASMMSFASGIESQPLTKAKILERKLIPIDHGLCIPDTLEICSYDLAWLSFSQAEEPFSQKSLQYIQNIDIMNDVKLLEETFKFRPQCLRNFRISSTLLKKGAEAGMTLAQIGQILCRPDEDDEQPSLLEQIVKRARMCANMMAQLQTKIKDSSLRLLLPQNSQSNTHRISRRYSGAGLNLHNSQLTPQVEAPQSKDRQLTKDDQVIEVNNSQHSPTREVITQEIKYSTDTKINMNQKEQKRLSQVRKRGYSDIDSNNLIALTLNTKASIQKSTEWTIKVGKDRQPEESKIQIANKKAKDQLMDSSSDSSDHDDSNHDDSNHIDNSLFQGFDFQKNDQLTPNSVPKSLSNMAQEEQKISTEYISNHSPQKEQQPAFSKAIKQLNKKLMPVPKKLRQEKDDLPSRLHSPKIIFKKPACLRRTTSFSCIQITEESDEDNDKETDLKCQVDLNQKSIDIQNVDGQSNEKNQLKKSSSKLSLMSISQASSNSRGFWNTKSDYSRNHRRPALNANKVSHLRRLQRQQWKMNSGGHDIYKQRRVKLDLERDMKWNGPHDEEFFRCFEQYLDEAIHKFMPPKTLTVQPNSIIDTQSKVHYGSDDSKDSSLQIPNSLQKSDEICNTNSPVEQKSQECGSNSLRCDKFDSSGQNSPGTRSSS